MCQRILNKDRRGVVLERERGRCERRIEKEIKGEREKKACVKIKDEERMKL